MCFEALVAERAFLAGIRAQALQVIRRDADVPPSSIGIGRARSGGCLWQGRPGGCDERIAGAGSKGAWLIKFGRCLAKWVASLA